MSTEKNRKTELVNNIFNDNVLISKFLDENKISNIRAINVFMLIMSSLIRENIIDEEDMRNFHRGVLEIGKFK